MTGFPATIALLRAWVLAGPRAWWNDQSSHSELAGTEPPSPREFGTHSANPAKAVNWKKGGKILYFFEFFYLFVSDISETVKESQKCLQDTLSAASRCLVSSVSLVSGHGNRNSRFEGETTSQQDTSKASQLFFGKAASC